MLNKIRTDMQGYTVKAMKTMPGHDGMAWSCSIYKGATKIVDAHDDGWGGPISLTYHCGPELQAEFKAAAKKSEPEFEFELEGTFAAKLADLAETMKMIERACKKKTLIQLVTDEEGAYRAIAVPFDAVVADKVRAKYGSTLRCIINEQL